MRALIVSPLGFLIGLSLGALGGGGSILAVPLLVYGAGQDIEAATASSLFLVGAAAMVGIGPHRRAGRVDVRAGVVFGVLGVPGSVAGSALNRNLDPDWLLLAFSALVLVAAWRMVTGCPTCTTVGEQREIEAADPGANAHLATRVRGLATPGSLALALTAGTAVGFLTGLFGVGGGFVIVPALALVMKMPMPTAIGTSLLVISINSAVALVPRLAESSIDWQVTIPFTIAAIGGVVAGGRIADRLDAQRSLTAFSVLLIAVALYTAADSIAGLT